MASNATSSVSCGVCSKVYKEPYMLTCLHSFCKKCLQKILSKRSSIKCPTCGETCTVQSNDLDLLPRDHRKVHEAEIAEYDSLIKGDTSVACDHCEKGRADVFCCNCCEFLCEKCADHHRSWRKARNHELISCMKESSKENILKKIHKPLTCHDHSNETVDYYCKTCCSVVCFRCAMMKHKDHACEDVKSVQASEKTGLMSYLGKAESARDKLKSSISHVEKIMQQIPANHKETDQKIEKAFEQVQQWLKDQKHALLTKSADIALGKEAALTLQRKDLKKLETAMSEVCTKLVLVTQDYSAVEMLSAKQPVSNRTQDLLNRFDKCTLAPCKPDTMRFSFVNSQLVSEIRKFGTVSGGCSPANSTIEAVNEAAFRVGKKYEFVLTAKGVDGNPFPYGGESIKATLSLKSSTAQPVSVNVVDNGNGTYGFSIIPWSLGEYKLSVTINNEHVENSPLEIYIRQSRNYQSLSQYTQAYSLSSYPGDVAVGDDGHVYVAVYGYHCITVFDINGRKIQTIGSTTGNAGSGNGQFSSPYGVAVKSDIMYVADSNNNRVQKLSTSGKFVTKFGTGGSGAGQLSAPRGIALDNLGRVFVSEYNNVRVSVFSADGTFSHHIRGSGSSSCTLSEPWGLAFDKNGNLHVADYGAHSIKVFTPDGTFIEQYGYGVIHYPAGIAIDDEGFTFVGNHYSNYCLYILNAQHQLVKTIQTSGTIVGVCLDRDGFVYSCNYDSCQVLKY